MGEHIQTSAEQREQWLKDIGPYLGKRGHGQSEIIFRLIFDVDHAEEEIKKLEDEILDCPADSAYHANSGKP